MNIDHFKRNIHTSLNCVSRCIGQRPLTKTTTPSHHDVRYLLILQSKSDPSPPPITGQYIDQPLPSVNTVRSGPGPARSTAKLARVSVARSVIHTQGSKVRLVPCALRNP